MFEKFICGSQTRNCHLRQVAEKRDGFITGKRARRRFDLVHTLRGWRAPSRWPGYVASLKPAAREKLRKLL